MAGADPNTDPPTYESIAQLLEHSAYHPAITARLEAYATAQLLGEARYFFDANRTLCKLYQFFPHLTEEEDGIVQYSQVLFLALLEYPSTDFSALCCLIPERVQSKEPCTTLVRCAEMLEVCQFEDFWSTFHQIGPNLSGRLEDEDKEEWEDVKYAPLLRATTSPRVMDQVRGGILQVLALTYRVAPLEMVFRALQLDSIKQVLAFETIVERIESNLVHFLPTAHNSKRAMSAGRSAGAGATGGGSNTTLEGVVTLDAISKLVFKTTQGPNAMTAAGASHSRPLKGKW